MPYSSTDELPAYVKKLPPNKQRQWMHVFNSCMKDGGSDSKCFAMANGVAKKSTDDFEPEGDIEGDSLTITLAEKAYASVDIPAPPETAPRDDEPIVIDTFEKLARAGMSASSFAYVDSHGGKHLPIHDAEHVRNALARFNQTHFESSDAKSRARKKILAAAKRFGVQVSGKSLSERLLDWLSGPSAVKTDTVEPLATDGLFIAKQTDGRLRWFARYSNAWEDRDGDILTEAAHKEYVSWAYENTLFPELWLWHTSGTKFGQADWLDFSDGFMHASGLIDAGREPVVEALKAQKLGVSHGFLAAQDGKYITRYRDFEISVLPLERAAVWTTDFNVIGKEDMMAFSKDRRDWLVKVLGEDTVTQLEGNTEAVAAGLKELGIEYKESAPPAEPPAETVDVKTFAETFMTQLTEQTAAIKSLTEAVGKIKGDVDSLKQTDDDKLADAFLARVQKAVSSGTAVRPTEQTKNVVAENPAPKPDFFTEQIMKQFGMVAQNGTAS